MRTGIERTRVTLQADAAGGEGAARQIVYKRPPEDARQYRVLDGQPKSVSSPIITEQEKSQ